MAVYNIFIMLVLAATAAVVPAPPSPALRCSLVLPPDTVLNHCASFTPSRTQIRSLLWRIAEYSGFIINNASCHPLYTSLTQAEKNLVTGSGSGINPLVIDNYALGTAVGTMKECFYEIISNLTDAETIIQMDNQPFHFATELRSIEGDISALVPLLHQLVRSNVLLSQGTSCIVPAASCIQQHTPTTRTNGDEFSPGQKRLMKLINVAFSTQRYAQELASLSFWQN